MPRAGSHIKTIFHAPETGCYGYPCHLPGSQPHYKLYTCLSLQSVLDACDPHREHIWEDPSDADEEAYYMPVHSTIGSIATADQF